MQFDNSLNLPQNSGTLNPNPVPEEASTLFLGDLSVFCTEKDIRKLFRPFGPIEAIRVKRGSSNKTNLSYGFIKFTLPESAEHAMKQLNGVMFLGRALRIGWAEGKNPNKLMMHPQKDDKKSDTAQVHVSFISKQVDVLITEATLRGLFSLYGEVVDVALKKSQFDRNLKIQNGYGFVHFPLTQEGIRAAITAVHSLHQVTIDRVTYDCSVSHALEELLGPQRVEDNPGAIPLNDRGFCLPNSMNPVMPRLPTSIPVDMAPPMDRNFSQGPNRTPRRANPGMPNMMMPNPYGMEPSMGPPQMSFQGLLGPAGFPPQYGKPQYAARPPMPPVPFPPTAMVFPPADPAFDLRLSAAAIQPTLSSDAYESLLASTERLSLGPDGGYGENSLSQSAESPDNASRSISGYTTSSASTMPQMKLAGMPPQVSTFPYAAPPMGMNMVVPPPLYTTAAPNAAFDGKNYYF